ncbi:hypothetical protein NDU88_004875 [Pleurodeles waltl]|uniref:Uncharacterized protein n=1 Tax=Pleurodeles waltl TaxID=8319 RepID=A0AAV7L1I6_PLEWA|nr:hypothetical protein NDU88_004875 [Pleurodeles waltl]
MQGTEARARIKRVSHGPLTFILSSNGSPKMVHECSSAGQPWVCLCDILLFVLGRPVPGVLGDGTHAPG